MLYYSFFIFSSGTRKNILAACLHEATIVDLFELFMEQKNNQSWLVHISGLLKKTTY